MDEEKKDNKIPSALILTDSHCGKETVNEFLINWSEAINICESRRISQILFGGDLVLSRASQTLDILLAIYDVFSNCQQKGIKVTLINGNHCKVNQEAKRGYCDIFDSFSNVRVINEWGEVKFSEDLSVGMISYFPENGSFLEKLDELEKYIFKIPYKYRLLLIHEGISGVLSMPTDQDVNPKVFSRWDKVLVGHYHNRCIIPGTNIEYIGSSRQHNFGEDEEKGYTILYNDGTQEFIKNKANTRFMVLDVPIEKVNIHLKDRLDEVKTDGKYKVKVRIHCDTAEANNINKNELIQCGASKVEVVTKDLEVKTITSTSLFEKFDSNKIQENYQQFCQEKNIEDVSLGLSYLAKIDKYVETN